jgi:hypothetical protein
MIIGEYLNNNDKEKNMPKKGQAAAELVASKGVRCGELLARWPSDTARCDRPVTHVSSHAAFAAVTALESMEGAKLVCDVHRLDPAIARPLGPSDCDLIDAKGGNQCQELACPRAFSAPDGTRCQNTATHVTYAGAVAVARAAEAAGSVDGMAMHCEEHAQYYAMPRRLEPCDGDLLDAYLDSELPYE